MGTTTIWRGTWLTAGAVALAACTASDSSDTSSPAHSSTTSEPQPVVAPDTTIRGTPNPPTPPPPPDAVPFEVELGHQAIRGVETPGPGEVVVLMHGFPDDSHIYDHLIGLIAPERHVVTFDFLGHGASDRPSDNAERASHEDQLAAVIDTLGLERPVLVAHDASGPVAIDYALDHPHDVGRLILLNTFYGNAPHLHFPEMIRLLADPELAPLADALLADPAQRLWLLQHTATQFGYDPLDPDGLGVTSVVPQFFGDDRNRDALGAIRAWTRDLFPDLANQDRQIAAGNIARLPVPVTVAFGRLDPYLNPEVAQHLAGLFDDAEVHAIDDASHWPQWDQPQAVAQLIRTRTQP
jgi:2-hydroxy-6-oxonona-2,4-dienedioate hydrolase